MKTILNTLKAHLRQEVTTVCTCLSIARRDGRAFYFTDHDEALVVESQVFVPFNSFARTSISTTSELEVDSMEVNGILNSGAVLRDDVNGGLFDYAAAEVFLVNYEDTSQGKLKLRRGTIGEVSMNEDGTFNAEVRGLTQVLATRVGDAYTPMCRADLGDRFCKVALTPARWQPDTAYAVGDFVTGIVTAAANYIEPPVANASFEADTPALYSTPTGWTPYGDGNTRWRVATSVDNGDPDDNATTLFAKIGAQFLCQGETGTTQATTGGVYQDLDIITAGVDADQVDTGLCRLYASIWVACPGDKATARVRAYCYDANGQSLGSIWDTQQVHYSPDNWNQLVVNNALIPAGTRKLRIDLYGVKQTLNAIGAAFDGLKVVINLPDGDFENHPQYGGKRMQCTTAGTTGASEPAFTDSTGATYSDGTVVWTAFDTLEDSGAVLTGAADQKSFTWTGGASKAGGYYDMGLLTWETGKNAGRSQEVKLYDGATATLFQRTFYAITPGDRFVIRPGCDKRRVTCIGTFGNIINMRAEPDVPGQDAYYATPNTTATDAAQL